MNKEAEKKAIDTLIKIAKRQQQIIQKLAAVVGGDPNIEYLQTNVPIAAANAGINNVVVSNVSAKPGGTANSGAVMESGYVVTVQGVPAKARDMFNNTWGKQLAAQKPDLVGRVSMIFQD